MATGRYESDREATDPPWQLLGRETELGCLTALVDSSRNRGGALVIRGEAGVGKSALLAVASAQARDQGLMVFTASCVESETRLTFAGLHALLRPFLGTFDQLPTAQRVGSVVFRKHAFR